MEEIAEIVRDGMVELVPVIKMEIIVCTGLVAVIFLATFGFIIIQAVKHHRKGKK